MNAKKEYYRTPRDEMAVFLPKQSKRVLEIGCGEGVFFENFDDNAEIWGVEPDIASARIAQKKAYKVFDSDYETASRNLPENYFDVIVCNDVIEHVADHVGMLKSIKAKLNSRGRLVASVPNVRFYTNLRNLVWNGEWQYKDSGILDRTHMRFFTKKSLQRTLIDSGYEIESCIGINSLLDRKLHPIPLIQRLFLKALTMWPNNRFSDIEYTQYAIIGTIRC